MCACGTFILTAPGGSAARLGGRVDRVRSVGSASVWAEKFLVMSGHTVPADISGHMLDLDEDEDLEVFSKVGVQRARASTLITCLNLNNLEVPVASVFLC